VMTQYHCRFMAQTGSDIIAGFSHKHGPMWKWFEGKRVSRAIWSFDWAWCVMDKTNVFTTCLWLIHWVQCAVRKSTLSECPGDKNPYKYQLMKQPHQKGTEMGTTWNFLYNWKPYNRWLQSTLKLRIAYDRPFISKKNRWLVQCDL